MILKPFKVHSPDGKTFYEGDAPKTLSDDLAHAKAVMEGRMPVFVRVDGVAQDDERTEFIRAYMAARPASVAQASDVFDQDWHGKQMWSAGIAYARAPSPQPVAQTEQSTDSEFKNFHRLLCERFDYTHDDKDWKRDQLSLIEWIARPAQCGDPVAWMNPNENFSKDAFLWAPDDWQFEYSVPVYAAPIAAQREMTDEQCEAIATSVTALTTLGWTHQVPVLIALLNTAQSASGGDHD